jgi:hypothetical protein
MVAAVVGAICLGGDCGIGCVVGRSFDGEAVHVVFFGYQEKFERYGRPPFWGGFSLGMGMVFSKSVQRQLWCWRLGIVFFLTFNFNWIN